MQKTYFTRRNLIFIALAALFSFLLIFVGICLEGDYSLVNSKNPIAGTKVEILNMPSKTLWVCVTGFSGVLLT